jgi:nitrite reductase (NADH) large subunit
MTGGTVPASPNAVTGSGETTVTRSLCVVEIREPGRDPQRLPVVGTLVIGRGPDGYTVLDGRVSRRHLRLTAAAGTLTATDLGSRNGTRFNGEPLTGSTPVRIGDLLAIGDVEIRVVAVPGVDESLMTTRARGSLRNVRVQAPPSRYTVEIRQPGSAPRRLTLGPVTDFGRENVTVTVDDPLVSRRHMRLTSEADGVVVTDLGSRNGTLLGGVPLTGPTRLRPGDQIRIGAARITLLANPAPVESLPAEPASMEPASVQPLPVAPRPPDPPTGGRPADRPTATGFPSYLQLPTRVPLVVWRGVQIVSVICFLALCTTLLIAPASGLFAFWNLIVPVLPALFLLAPGLWRNICPLAASNQASRLLRITSGRRAPAWLTTHGYLISAVAFVAIVTSRKVLFNSAATALAALLLSVIGLAFTGGLLFKGKSGWCSSICPLLPVQRLYGQTPFVLVPNSHCRPCVGCTKNCYDFNPPVAYQADLRDDDPGWSGPRKLFAGAFPGLVLGYFSIPAPPAITVQQLYLRFGLFLLASAGSFFVLDAVLRGRSAMLAAAYGAGALILFYYYQAVPITRSIERMTGADVHLAVWPLRAGVLVLGLIWLWRTFRTERRVIAHSSPAAGPVSLNAPQVRAAAGAGGRPEVRFTPQDRRVVTAPGRTLLEIAEADGLPVEAGCRMGLCGADPVAVLEGADQLSPLDDGEVITLTRLGYGPNTRLACCARVHGNVTVSLTPDPAGSEAPSGPNTAAADVDTSIRKVVVIGHGIAGVTAADLVRRRHPDCDLDVIGQEAHALYNRMAISRLIHGRSAMQGLYLQPETWYKQRRIVSWLNTRARLVDLDARQVQLATGERLDYDRLILANGSTAAVPRIEGFGRPGTFVLRQAGDAIAVRAFAQQHGARQAVVAGGGLLGLEAAYSLHQLGLGVTVLERSARLLNRRVDETCSALLSRYVEELGIQLVVDADAEVVTGPDRVELVGLKDGRNLSTDLLVVCAGIRPDVGLARDAGIAVGQGILVDDRMRTSAPDVYAAGDVAEFGGQVPGLWPVAVDQALVAAVNATGGEERYRPAAQAMILKGIGIDLTVAGVVHPVPTSGAPDDEVVTFSGPARYMYGRLVIRDGKLVGGLVLDRAADAPAVLAAVRDQISVAGRLDALRAGDLTVLAGSSSTPDRPAMPVEA